MALVGIHIACRYMGSLNGANPVKDVWGPVVWSETPAAAGTTTNAVPVKPDPQYGDAVVTVRPVADSFITYGPIPADPAVAANARDFVAAGTTVHLAVPAGSKIRWATA
jgi:hypothetical protein